MTIGVTAKMLVLHYLFPTSWQSGNESFDVQIRQTTSKQHLSRFENLKRFSKYILTTLNVFKMGQLRPRFVYFCLFHTTIFKYKLIKAQMVCLGLKLGWQDGRRKQIHRAFAAFHLKQFLKNILYFDNPYSCIRK